MVLIDLGRPQDAEPVLRELLRIDPGKVQGHFWLGAALFQLAERHARNPAEKEQSQQQFREAADQARQALALQPHHGFAYVYLGLSLRHLGQLDEMLDALESAVRCNPEAVDPHLHFGVTLAQANRRAEAITQFQDAIRIAPASDRRAQEALQRLLGTR